MIHSDKNKTNVNIGNLNMDNKRKREKLENNIDKKYEQLLITKDKTNKIHNEY